jgi:adenine-specific DNA-methyltransferase
MAKNTTIGSITHTENKRVNIPTEQLRNMVPDDDKTAKNVFYPRDPSLDPQLVWNGKDEQDSKDLEVPAVPIYIQEKIHPHSIVESLRVAAAEDDGQFSLFSDFNGINFEDMVDFYQHEQNWQNRMILGDSLLVMNSLAEKENMKGKVQMVYMDPPYGIKFGSNWQVSTRKRDVKDGKAEDAIRQPEQVKAFRDTWEKGIHSYLAYLRDRLVLARELLTESGSVFLQIGDENVHLVRCLMDEIFGSENFVSQISVLKTAGKGSRYVDPIFDYLIFYAKNIEQLKYRNLFIPKEFGSEKASEYRYVMFPNGSFRTLKPTEIENSEFPSNGKLFRPSAVTSQTGSRTTEFTFKFRDKEYKPTSGGWKTNEKGLKRLTLQNRIMPRLNSLSYIRFLEDFPVTSISNLWNDVRWGFDASEKKYVVETNVRVVQRCLLMTTDPGDIVLDPTCGSGTTAYVAEQWGRRWITTDTSRVALALARTRIMAARYPYYLLADSEEGQKKEMEITQKVLQEEVSNDIRKGFVYRRVPHITLKAIANNEEIDEIYNRWQDSLEPLRTKLNSLLGKNYEEWEIPREAEETWNSEVKKIHKEWWDGRISRQNEIDESIARAADTEFLFDQPYEDNKKLRVSGPFTVESLSPHRIVSGDEESPASETEAQTENPSNFTEMILGNLKKAGVQNTVKDQRLKFETLEPFAGTWIHAYGEYLENEKNKRVAVCVGPQYGTVDADMIRDASIEASEGVGVDLLVICAFAFEGNTGDTAQTIMKRYGKLNVMLARMNPDLAMGDELLKKTGAGNLFTVFGEPDVEITKQPDGKLVVEVKGVDIYDPTTGEIRSSSTDDIACWFIDTNYNGQSFFVRHAYFTGADKPYEKLKKTLRAEIDEEAWDSIYATVSRPFKVPGEGKIAVKIINHYGDEVLKVYDVRSIN